MELSLYFEDLERRISADDEARLAAEWLSFADRNLSEGYFAPSRPAVAPAIDWPGININSKEEPRGLPQGSSLE